jgi:uncharacterized membrane protein
MVLIEILTGILSAIFKSAKGISNKYAIEVYNDIEVGTVLRVLVVFSIIPIYIFVPFKFSYSNSLILVLFLDSIFLVVGGILVSYTLRVSDISLVTPIFAITPIITAIYSIIFLNEIPSFIAMIGIIMISVGVYLLNVKSVSRGLLEPIRRLYDDRGVQVAFFTSFFTSLIPILDKIGIEQTSPFTWPLLLNLGAVIISLPYLVYKRDYISSKIYNNRDNSSLFLILMGISTSIVWVSQSFGYSLTNVAYIVSLKRISVLITIISGHVLFKEDLALSRIPGGIFIIVGVILISLGI